MNKKAYCDKMRGWWIGGNIGSSPEMAAGFVWGNAFTDHHAGDGCYWPAFYEMSDWQMHGSLKRQEIRTCPAFVNSIRPLRNILLAACVWLMGMVVCTEASITVSFANPAPDLDGALTDSCWQGEGVFQHFSGEDPNSTTGTEFAIVRDDYGVYIALRCYEPNLSQLDANATEYDGLYTYYQNDDWVEVLIDPGNTGYDYYWFMVNPAGLRTDLCAMADPDRSWNGEWQAETGLEADAWTVEVFIPFATFNRKPISDTEWHMNLARNKRTPTPAFTVWAGEHREPQTWSTLTGVERDAALFQYEVSPVVLTPSANPAAAKLSSNIRNMTGGQVTLQPVFRIMRPGSAQGYFPHGTGPRENVSASPVTLDNGASAEVEVPVSVGSNEVILVQMALIDQAGHPVYITPDKGIRLQYPIDGPGPEFNFYTSESEARMRFDLRETGENLKLAVTVQSGGQQFFSNEVSAVSSPVYVNVGLGNIPVGNHEVVVELVENGTNTAERSYNLNKLSPPSGGGSEVKTRRWSQSFVVDGKPFIPVGNSPGLNFGLDSAISRMGTMADGGLNTMHLWRVLKRDENGQKLEELDFDTIASCFAAAQSNDLKMIISLGELIQNNPNSPFFYGSWTDSERLNLITQMVAFVQNRHELLGYEIADEPEWFVAPEWLETVYQTIKNTDPYHPATINNCRGARSILNYARASDTAGVDYYPCGRWPASTVGALTEEVVKFGACKPVKMWIQGYKISNPRAPTPAEIKGMTYMMLARGASAFFYFIGIPEESLWQAQSECAQELSALADVVAADRREPLVTVPSDSPVYASFRDNGKEQWVIAVNESDSAVDASIALPNDMTNRNVIVLFEGRTAVLESGEIMEHFQPWERHVYNLAPPGMSILVY